MRGTSRFVGWSTAGALLCALLLSACSSTDLAEGIANRALDDEGISIDIEDGGQDVTVQTSEGEISVDADDDGSFTYEGPDGTVTSSGAGELPEQFPDSFPLPEGYTVEAAISAEGATDSVIFTIGLPGTLAESTDFYAAALRSGGYTIVSQFSSGDAASFQFSGNGQEGNVALAVQGDGTVLSGQIQLLG